MMLFKDAVTGQNLLKKYVNHETNVLYLAGIAELKELGFIIRAIVCDGRKGLIQSFGTIPVQMCQFHQSEIMRRYLTKRPQLKAAKELLYLTDLMKQTDRESFEGAVEEWRGKWQNFIN